MWVEQKYISGQSIDYTDANSILLSEFFLCYLRALMPMLLTKLLRHVGQTAGKFYLTQK